jgi:phosphate acyltransferase
LRRIALDAMGGDHAPAVEVEAAVHAVREREGFELVLVGDETRVAAELARHGSPPRIAVQHASQVITMDDAPASAVRGKKDSSMRVAFDLVKEKKTDAVVSAGNSGAMLACGLFVLGRLEGVERPGIVATFPTVSGECLLCDMGANVDPKPEVLAQFGLLGAVYAHVLLRKERPKVGLLSNGAEEHKGTELTRAAHEILTRVAKGSDLIDYAGYVEGRDIFLSELDVVATDGFTGNVLLKTAEGAGLAIMHLLKRAFTSSARAKLGALLARPALLALKKKIDYAETGGAPLLGVDGTVIICHGGSSAVALKNALFAADRFVERGLTGQVASAIRRHSFEGL